MVRDWMAPSLVCAPRVQVVKVIAGGWLPGCDDDVEEWVFVEQV